MEDSTLSDNADCGAVDPFPEHDILVIGMGLDFLLGFNVEDLEGPSSWGLSVNLCSQ